MLWKILGGVGLLLVIAFSSLIGKQVGKGSVENYYTNKNKGAFDEELTKSVSQINANLPRMVDTETRLDSAVGSNKNLRYNYTLVNYSEKTLSADALNNAVGKNIVNEVCTAKETKVFIKNGVTISFAYHGNEGKQITVISVAPSQCDNT